MADMVNHPAHYKHGQYECIDVMLDVFGPGAVIDFCMLNAFKYLYRAPYKNGNEDIKKAQWYLEKIGEIRDEYNLVVGASDQGARHETSAESHRYKIRQRPES